MKMVQMGFRASAALFAASMLAACATPVTSSVNLQTLQTQAGSDILDAGLGDIVLESANVAVSEAVNLENEVSWGDGVLFFRVTIRPGRLVSYFRDEAHIYYESDRATVYDAALGTFERSAGICVALEDRTYVRGFIEPGRCASEPNEPPIFTTTEVRFIPDDGYRRELIYTGRNADRLRFVYREISGDPKVDMVERQLELPLQQGQPVTVETASFEVVEATLPIRFTPTPTRARMGANRI